MCFYQIPSQYLFLGGHSLLCNSMFVYLARYRKDRGEWLYVLIADGWKRERGGWEIKCFKCMCSRILKKIKCGINNNNITIINNNSYEIPFILNVETVNEEL